VTTSGPGHMPTSTTPPPPYTLFPSPGPPTPRPPEVPPTGPPPREPAPTALIVVISVIAVVALVVVGGGFGWPGWFRDHTTAGMRVAVDQTAPPGGPEQPAIPTLPPSGTGEAGVDPAAVTRAREYLEAINTGDDARVDRTVCLDETAKKFGHFLIRDQANVTMLAGSERVRRSTQLPQGSAASVDVDATLGPTAQQPGKQLRFVLDLLVIRGSWCAVSLTLED
jgi:hypothetical protein